MRSASLTILELLRRFVAAGSASLVLALAVFAASPAWHGELHDAEHHAPDDDGCAIALFADGIALPLDAVAACGPASLVREEPSRCTAEIFLAAPRYLHPPERGPPELAN